MAPPVGGVCVLKSPSYDTRPWTPTPINSYHLMTKARLPVHTSHQAFDRVQSPCGNTANARWHETTQEHPSRIGAAFLGGKAGMLSLVRLSASLGELSACLNT
jgi:hypothetical protein